MKIIGAIALLLILAFSLQGLGYISLKFWGPKYEDARREIFENTKSYKHGMIRDLQNLRMEYKKATDEGTRGMLSDTILHRTAALPLEGLPYDLRNFITTLRK